MNRVYQALFPPPKPEPGNELYHAITDTEQTNVQASFNFGQPFLKFGHLPGICQAREPSREVDKLQHAVKSYTELKESSNLAADYK